MTEPKHRINLGWANGWKDDPELVTNCRKLNHAEKSKNLDHSHHGLDTLYWCDICGYEYHVDSSD